MTEQEIKEIEVAIKHIETRNMSAKHLDMAVEALERQIPMQHHHTRIDKIDDYVRVSICPNCLSVIYTYIVELPAYCTHCGQHIDWTNK